MTVQFARGLRLGNGIVVSVLEDTIAHELRFNRGQDIIDVQNMLETSDDRLHEDRLRQILGQLGVPFQRYQRIRSRMHHGRKRTPKVPRKP
jgi:hypothetical protein